MPRGIATTDFVVARAEGATLWDADGREFLDFAGGIACQNLGTTPRRSSAPCTSRSTATCTSASWSGCTSRTSRSPPAGRALAGRDRTKSVLLNSGAEAIENAVKIARAATERPAVVVFDRAFHGRTNLTMAMTSSSSTSRASGRSRPTSTARPRPIPTAESRPRTRSPGSSSSSSRTSTRKAVACIVLETVQGEGGFIPMPADFVRALSDLRAPRDPLRRRRGAVRLRADRARLGDRAPRRRARPDRLGKTLGGGLPLAAVTGKAELMDAPHPGGLGGTFGGNPVSCAAACAILDASAEPGFRERADEVGQLVRARLDELAAAHAEIGEVRGLGPMLALEFAEQTGMRRRTSPPRPASKGCCCSPAASTAT